MFQKQRWSSTKFPLRVSTITILNWINIFVNSSSSPCFYGVLRLDKHRSDVARSPRSVVLISNGLKSPVEDRKQTTFICGAHQCLFPVRRRKYAGSKILGAAFMKHNTCFYPLTTNQRECGSICDRKSSGVYLQMFYWGRIASPHIKWCSCFCLSDFSLYSS